MPACLRTPAWSMMALTLLVSIGCTGATHSGSGVVQFDDRQPVQSGSIELRSLADGLRYASRIAGDGSFTLADQDGVVGCPPGDYEVVIVQIVLTEDLAAADHQHGRTVPRRYADYYTSGLRTTKADDDALIRIVLETDAAASPSGR